MSFADLRIVAIAIVLSTTYGLFMYFYSAQPAGSPQNPAMPGQNYTAPESASFFQTVQNMISLNVQNPEIFFVNSILFFTMAALIVFVVLRYLRGTG